MTQRITKKDVERKFTEAAAAARAAGLTTDGWRFELGNASMGINYTLSTGQHGSSSVYVGGFDRIGGTAAEAYHYLEALTAAWDAVVRANAITAAARVQVHMTATSQDFATGVWTVACRCGWTGGGPTRETAREAGDAHLAEANG